MYVSRAVAKVSATADNTLRLYGQSQIRLYTCILEIHMWRKIFQEMNSRQPRARLFFTFYGNGQMSVNNGLFCLPIQGNQNVKSHAGVEELLIEIWQRVRNRWAKRFWWDWVMHGWFAGVCGGSRRWHRKWLRSLVDISFPRALGFTEILRKPFCEVFLTPPTAGICESHKQSSKISLFWNVRLLVLCWVEPQIDRNFWTPN